MTSAAQQWTQRVGIEHPIIQGPFGGGYSTASLTATVSNGGGLGSFGAHHLSPEAILQTASEIRHRTRRPFALNLWVSNQDPAGTEPPARDVARFLRRIHPYFAELGITTPEFQRKPVHRFEDQARALIEARPAVFSFVFGIPSPDILALARQRGVLLAGAATTLDEALALESAGVDMIIASGMEAGGHRPSFLRPAEDSLTGTMSLTAIVTSRVRIPVIAAGGIADARGVSAAIRLGASGAQVGTAFLACEESGAPEIHRRMLLAPAAAHTLLTRVFSGRLARGLRNRLANDLAGFPVLPYPAQGWMMGALRDAAIAQGKPDFLSLWAGQSAALLNIQRAEELLPALLSQL